MWRNPGRCPKCKSEFSYEDKHAGWVRPCPICGEKIDIEGIPSASIAAGIVWVLAVLISLLLLIAVFEGEGDWPFIGVVGVLATIVFATFASSLMLL